jgi:vacuolar-type H+-ATPase subunit C/Vma6
MQPPQFEQLLETGSLAETVSAVTGGHVTSAEESDLSSVESYLIRRTIELAERLAFYAPQDSRPLIYLFAKRFEFGCVKAILNAIAANVNAEEALRYIVPAGKFTSDRCKDLIEAHNPIRVIENVDDESFKRFLAPKLSGEGAGIHSTSAIDLYYFTRLWAASNLRDLVDTQSAKSLIGEAIDHTNILIAFRSRLMGLDARTSSAIMIPVNYGLGRAFDELAEANDVQDVLRILEKTRYASMFAGSVTLDGERAEYALNCSHAKTCLDIFAGYPFNVGLALAFLYLKNYELRDLFGLINAKANNVPTERALASLVLPNLSLPKGYNAIPVAVSGVRSE